jgi:hypothetical protein
MSLKVKSTMFVSTVNKQILLPFTINPVICIEAKLQTSVSRGIVQTERMDVASCAADW